MRHIQFARSPRLLCVLLFIGFSSAQTGHASPQSHRPATSLTLAQEEGTTINDDGSYRLRPDAPAPPPAATYANTAQFQRYGFLLSTPQQLAQPARRVLVRYSADVPAATAMRVDLRASVDGSQWGSWEVAVADGAEVDLHQAARVLQYRVTLLGTSRQSPTLRRVELLPTTGSASYRTFSEQPRAVAPTYRVRATRMGMVGGRTANGHIIKPRDHYVSLPSWRSLCSKGGREYLVRITYNGRSSVAPVWDVGPWNTRDNYWDEERERYKDLRRGWPQDHAAYYENYNNRRAEKGYVRFPTAVDVGDGVWWDDLGIRGDQATIDITFLWLGEDPGAAATPIPSPTATATPMPEATSVPTTTVTATPEATSVPTATLTATAAPSEATATPVETTTTPEPPVATTEATATPEPPAATAEPTAVATAESTSSPSPAPSAEPSPVPSAESAPSAEPTASETPAPTATPSQTTTPSPTATPVNTSPTVTATVPISATAPAPPAEPPDAAPLPADKGGATALLMDRVAPVALYRREEALAVAV